MWIYQIYRYWVFFLPGNDYVAVSVSGEKYAEMLQNHIIPIFAGIHLPESAVFMQDDTSPHIVRLVKNLIRTTFGEDRVLSCHTSTCVASEAPRSHSV